MEIIFGFYPIHTYLNNLQLTVYHSIKGGYTMCCYVPESKGFGLFHHLTNISKK